jgi:PTS system beta-glucosides-specific IIC component
MVYAVICGAVGGAVMGAGGVYGDAFANNGILTLATYAAFGIRKFLFYLAGICISFFGAAFMTFLLGFEDLD